MLGNMLAVAAGSAHAPLLTEIADSLGVPVARAQLTISLYFFVYAFAQMAIALATGSLDRRSTLLWSLAAVTAGCAASAVAPTVETLIAARILQAMGACGMVLMARVLIRETLEDRTAARSLSALVRVTSLALVVGPIVAGAIGYALGWRALFIAMAVWAAGAWLAVRIGIPAARKNPGAAPPRPAGGGVGAILALLRRPRFWAFMAINGGGYGAYYGYIAGAPVGFHQAGLTEPYLLGIAVSIPGVGLILGAILAGRLSATRDFAQAIDLGARLIVGTAMAAPALALLGVPAAWLVAAAGLAWGTALGVVQPNAMLGAMSLDPRQIAMAAALLGSSQILAGALMALAVAVTGRETGGLLLTLAAAQVASALLWYTLGRRRETARPETR